MKRVGKVMVSGVSGASQFGGGSGGDGSVCSFLILGGGGGSGRDDSTMWKEGLPWWRKKNDHKLMEVRIGEDGGVEL